MTEPTPEAGYCRWCADEAFDPRACTCPHNCGIDGCGSEPEPDD